jgi:hypothetical protein
MHTPYLSLPREIFNIIATCVCSVVLILIPVSVQAIAITPSVTEVVGERGEVISETITIINIKTTDQTYYLDTLKFEASEDGGSPRFISGTEGYEGLSEWIELETRSITVPALSRAEVAYNIRIPSVVESGGYYAAITVSTAPAEIIATNGAIIDARTAGLLLLEVTGENVKKAVLLDFIDTEAERFKSFIGGQFSYRIQNQGNVHITPVGTITFKDFFGRTLKQVDANKDGARVLPSSTRSFTVAVLSTSETWLEVIQDQMRLFVLGPITIDLEVMYDDSGVILSQSTSQFFFPWQLFLFLSVFVSLFFLVYSIGKKRR